MQIHAVLCNVLLLMVMSHLVSPISCSGIDELAARHFKNEIVKMVEKAKYDENFQIRLDTEARRVAISEAKRHAYVEDVKVGEFEELPQIGMKKLEMLATYLMNKTGAIEECVKTNRNKIIEAVQTGFNVACFGSWGKLHFVLVTRNAESVKQLDFAIKSAVDGTVPGQRPAAETKTVPNPTYPALATSQFEGNTITSKTPAVSHMSTEQQPTAGNIVQITQSPTTTVHPATSSMLGNRQHNGETIPITQATDAKKPATPIPVRLEDTQTIVEVPEFKATPDNEKAAESVRKALTTILTPVVVTPQTQLPKIEEMEQDERTKLWSHLRNGNAVICGYAKYKLIKGTVRSFGSNVSGEFKLDSGITFDAQRQLPDNDITEFIEIELARLNSFQGLTKNSENKVQFAVETGEIKDNHGTWSMCIILFNPKGFENAKQPLNRRPPAVAQKPKVTANPVPLINPAEKIESAVKTFVNNIFKTDINAVKEMTRPERKEIHECVKDNTKTKRSETEFKYCFIFTVGPDAKSTTLRKSHSETQFPGTNEFAVGQIITDDRFKSLANKTAEAYISEHIESLLKDAGNNVKGFASSMKSVQWAVEYLPLEIKGNSYIYFVLVINGM